jgi:hypothetical protein
LLEDGSGIVAGVSCGTGFMARQLAAGGTFRHVVALGYSHEMLDELVYPSFHWTRVAMFCQLLLEMWAPFPFQMALSMLSTGVLRCVVYQTQKQRCKKYVEYRNIEGNCTRFLRTERVGYDYA